MIDLAAALPQMLPLAIAWVEAQEAKALGNGRPLTASEVALAAAVGVRHPERVRLEVVTALPQPPHPELRAMANQSGLLGPHMVALTFGYAIFVRQSWLSNRLLSHELRHVFQYETAGSVAAFLSVYLQQIATVGYEQAPHEIDARQHERDAP